MNSRSRMSEPATEDCGSIGAGYVFVYVTDDTTMPVSDPLVEPTAIEFPWLTVVPFYLDDGGTGRLPPRGPFLVSREPPGGCR